MYRFNLRDMLRFWEDSVDVWARESARLGLSYRDQVPRALDKSIGEHVAYDYYIANSDVSAEGWRARAPFFDYEDPDGNWQVKDKTGVFIPSRKADVVCFGPDGWTRTLPEPGRLAGITLAVSPGNGRLVLIDLRPDGLVRVLPFAFEGRSEPVKGSRFPFVDRDLFRSELNGWGQVLQGVGDDHWRCNLDAFTRGLGFLVRSRTPFAHQCEKSKGEADVAFSHGWRVAMADMSADGWRVQEASPDDGDSRVDSPRSDSDASLCANVRETAFDPGFSVEG